MSFVAVRNKNHCCWSKQRLVIFYKTPFWHGVSWCLPSYHQRGRSNWWGFHQGIHDVSHAVQESTTWECSLTVRSVNHIKGAAAMLRKMRQMILVIRAKAGELGCWPDGLKWSSPCGWCYEKTNALLLVSSCSWKSSWIRGQRLNLAQCSIRWKELMLEKK